MLACPHSQTPNSALKPLIYKAFPANFCPGKQADSTTQHTNQINHLRASFERG